VSNLAQKRVIMPARSFVGATVIRIGSIGAAPPLDDHLRRMLSRFGITRFAPR
jgi:hypothetical protein